MQKQVKSSHLYQRVNRSEGVTLALTGGRFGSAYFTLAKTLLKALLSENHDSEARPVEGNVRPADARLFSFFIKGL